jgi:hypothetical protein
MMNNESLLRVLVSGNVIIVDFFSFGLYINCSARFVSVMMSDNLRRMKRQETWQKAHVHFQSSLSLDPSAETEETSVGCRQYSRCAERPETGAKDDF